MSRLAGILAVAVVLLLPGESSAQSCSSVVDPVLDFGTTTGLPPSHIDVAATISITCTGLLSLTSTQVCLSIGEGSGGVSIADRRLISGAHHMRYQIYTDAARTTVWGAVGGSSPPHTVTFPAVSETHTINVPIYGRVFGGQAGKAVGLYASDLAPIQTQAQINVLSLLSCSSLTSGTINVSPFSARLEIAPNCSIAASPLDFGRVSSLTGIAASTNLSVACTLNGAYSIALDGGTTTGDVADRRMKRPSGPDTISYQLYRDAARTQLWGTTLGMVVSGVGTGAVQSIPIFGVVPTQGPKAAGTYVDVITVTVTF